MGRALLLGLDCSSRRAQKGKGSDAAFPVCYEHRWITTLRAFARANAQSFGGRRADRGGQRRGRQITDQRSGRGQSRSSHGGGDRQLDACMVLPRRTAFVGGRKAAVPSLRALGPRGRRALLARLRGRRRAPGAPSLDRHEERNGCGAAAQRVARVGRPGEGAAGGRGGQDEQGRDQRHDDLPLGRLAPHALGLLRTHDCGRGRKLHPVPVRAHHPVDRDRQGREGVPRLHAPAGRVRGGDGPRHGHPGGHLHRARRALQHSTPAGAVRQAACVGGRLLRRDQDG
mmetsp:Transcript_63341/g.142860  ORF Transcript_63341/g.142860 Transcript_63341/m.142860 type:complete len:285 (+) Transcript_63341:309-1163(+)